MPLLDEARQRFEAVAKERPDKGAERMASVCFAEQGDCLRNLGRLDEAAAAYEESIRRAEQLGDARQVAVGKGQLGTVRMLQRRYPEALAAYAEARERFTQLDEPGTVAVVLASDRYGVSAGGPAGSGGGCLPKIARDRGAARKCRRAGEYARSTGELVRHVLGRPEEAVAFYRQAADKYVEIGDAANEGRARNNLGNTLRKLRRLDEARQEIRRAIECKAAVRPRV